MSQNLRIEGDLSENSAMGRVGPRGQSQVIKSKALGINGTLDQLNRNNLMLLGGGVDEGSPYDNIRRKDENDYDETPITDDFSQIKESTSANTAPGGGGGRIRSRIALQANAKTASKAAIIRVNPDGSSLGGNIEDENLQVGIKVY